MGQEGWQEHVRSLRDTMFYVCQGSCLCGTAGTNKGKVIYCYGDLVPRQGELFSEESEDTNKIASRDLVAAQLGVWVIGLLALLLVLLLIRKSVSSLREHLEQVTERLPWYHDDDDLVSEPSATSPPIHHKDTTMESMDNVRRHKSEKTAVTPSYPSLPNTPSSVATNSPIVTIPKDKVIFPAPPQYSSFNPSTPSFDCRRAPICQPDRCPSPLLLPPSPLLPPTFPYTDIPLEDGEVHENDIEGEQRTSDTEKEAIPGLLWLRRTASKGLPTGKLMKLRLKKKDYKKGGEGLRGKNVMEGARVKTKDLNRMMK